MSKVYAGIGSRETPRIVLDQMFSIGKELCSKGYWLRTGNALGADQSFAAGSNSINPRKTILYLPWPGYEAGAIKEGNRVILDKYILPLFQGEAREVIKELHPNPYALKQGAWELHTRNCFILMGKEMDTPVDFVICWTKGGKASGGTGMGIRIAQKYGIPVYNLYNMTPEQILIKVAAEVASLN